MTLTPPICPDEAFLLVHKNGLEDFDYNENWMFGIEPGAEPCAQNLLALYYSTELSYLVTFAVVDGNWRNMDV